MPAGYLIKPHDFDLLTCDLRVNSCRATAVHCTWSLCLRSLVLIAQTIFFL